MKIANYSNLKKRRLTRRYSTTTPAVTPRACARVAPAGVVADLGRSAKMKNLLFTLFTVAAVQAAEPPPAVTNEKPFEPTREAFFDASDKFVHPRELIAPKFLMPAEGRHGIGAAVPAEVVVLVQADASGFAKSLYVLSSNHAFFAHQAIAALQKARWECSKETWFYYRAQYSIDE